MYQAYWGLSQSPFRGNLDPRFFYQSPAQEEALARLHFLVDDRRTMGLLLGDSGAGKTMLLETFARQLGCIHRQHALLSLIGLNGYEFLWLCCGALGVEAPPHASQFALTRALVDHITANRYQQIATLLLLDDADHAGPEVQDLLVRLAQLDTSGQSQLTLVLSAAGHRLHTLGTRLLELADLRIDLEPWESDDTAAYIRQSLALAGRTAPLFTEAALAQLHTLADGVPRRVKQLADLALLAGAGGNLSQIEPDTVEAVYHELAVVSATPPAIELVRR
jgi:general secretion pathway protein A